MFEYVLSGACKTKTSHAKYQASKNLSKANRRFCHQSGILESEENHSCLSLAAQEAVPCKVTQELYLSYNIQKMGEEVLELKFRLYDGTDIGPNKYGSATTVATLKQSILAQWPKEKENGPRTISDMKLINAGRILENNKTLAESRVPVGELPGGVITMHVVVRPPTLDKKLEKPSPGSPKKKKCGCSIL